MRAAVELLACAPQSFKPGAVVQRNKEGERFYTDFNSGLRLEFMQVLESSNPTYQ